MTFINDIGEILKNTRESSGISLEEVSKDLEMPIITLEQIEDGNIGAFKDIFELKDNLSNYAKYLGLNETEVIDSFNEYMFERTSKIPMHDIEKAVKEKQQEDLESTLISSPYTKTSPIKNNKQFVIIVIIIVTLIIIAVIWSIKQITFGNTTTNILNYLKN